ncbi:hypothetical protein D3C86_1748910 [compost metagenome]
MRRLQPRGHVPVDVAHIVAGTVFAQIGKVQPEAAEQGAVVALEHAIEPAHHGPLQAAHQHLGLAGARAAQRRLRGGRDRGERGSGVRAGPAPSEQPPEHGLPAAALARAGP